ncbi:peptide ABC transporter substrate-binding protein [Spirabiliibacterium falconis]|uniref:peptide ABC transporter substrate-binding protein n=1 Tax=Spirabiliibacterium falconis TaxID=572023 RepID=UPI001AACA8B2|nr:peptide ABC transporter substrate-binding protein [Spirabiliibacterium falconis]MBE2894325.1 peptide ABC transporter substrate-binding protein [Spirabiliibacterium falconis]
MNRTLLFYRLIFASFALCLISGCDNPNKPSPSLPKGDAQVVKAPKGDEISRKRLERGMDSPFVFLPTEIQAPGQRALIYDLYAGLVRLTSDGNIESAVASHWEQRSPTEWQFYLRDDAKWSNDEPLVAQDFVQSWWQLALSESPLREYLRYLHLANTEAVLAKTVGVESLGVKALDEHTLQLTLSEPVPFLPKLLAHAVLLPVYQQESAVLVSNGAYRLTSHNHETAVLEKNQTYFNQANVAFEQVRYHAGGNMPLDIAPVKAPRSDDQTQKHILPLPQLCTYYYEMNFRHPQLKQSAVRQALNAMIARHDLIPPNVMNVRVNAQYLPHNLQTETQSQGWVAVVPEQQFTQAGVSREKPLKLRLTYDDAGIHPAVAQQLVRMFSQSDLIHIQPEAVSTSELLQRRNSGDFDLIRSGWCADFHDPAAFFDPLYSHSPNNKMGINEPDIDELLKAVYQQDISDDARRALYDKLAGWVDEKQVVLPLFQAYRYLLISDSVQGVEANNRLGYLPSEGLYRKVTP